MRKIKRIFAVIVLLAIVAYFAILAPQNAKDQRSLLNGNSKSESEVETDVSEVTSEEALNEDGLPNIDVTSWEYLLANSDNNIGDYAPELGTVEGVEFDERIVDAMTEMISDARAEGLNVYLSSGYRSEEEQQYLFDRKVAQVGEEEAATIVAVPGTSEHQTGLAADITDQYYETKDESLEDTDLYIWLSQHCQEYGFIVRYPKGAEDITGIIYEPWHFRYVGVEAATYIMENDLTLEEFLELYE